MANLNSTTISDLEITGSLVINGTEITPKAAATYTPSTSAQTIAAGQYLVGTQTIAAIPSNYVVPSGDVTITQQSGQSVSGNATATVRTATASMPSSLSGTSATASLSGTTLTLTKSLTNAATVTTAGWLSSLSGTTSVSLSGTVPTETKTASASGDITPTSGKLLSKVTVPAGSASTPDNSSGTALTSTSTSLSGSTLTVQASVTPTVSAGWVSSGTAGTVKISGTVPSASGYSLSITDKASTNLTVGTLSSGYYTFTTSLTGTLSASTGGYFTSGSATDSSVTVGRLPAAVPSASVSSYTAPSVTVEGAATGFTASSSATDYYVTVTGTPSNGSVKAKYTNSTAGYAPQNTTGTESGATTITPSVPGNGTKIYIPAESKTVDFTGGDMTISSDTGKLLSEVNVTYFNATSQLSSGQVYYVFGEAIIGAGYGGELRGTTATIKDTYFKVTSVSTSSSTCTVTYQVPSQTINTSGTSTSSKPSWVVNSTSPSASNVNISWDTLTIACALPSNATGVGLLKFKKGTVYLCDSWAYTSYRSGSNLNTNTTISNYHNPVIVYFYGYATASASYGYGSYTGTNTDTNYKWSQRSYPYIKNISTVMSRPTSGTPVSAGASISLQCSTDGETWESTSATASATASGSSYSNSANEIKCGEYYCRLKAILE